VGEESAADDADTLVGDPQSVAQRLSDLAALGFTAFNVILAGPDPYTQAERLAHEVIPLVRTQVGSPGRD
jgi:alkanesulfonate monooxygenase SsuD/methylene tetrahydromethanopterin reductase-like flavin-dependent oxidoreductase (luciferase family)